MFTCPFSGRSGGGALAAVASALLSSAVAFAGSYTVSAILPPSGFTSISMYGINSGQVAGAVSGVTERAFVGSPRGSGAVPLLSGFTFALSYAVNNSGQVAGYNGTDSGNYQPFIGTPSGSIAIPLPTGWTNAMGAAVNDAGQVAGGGATCGGRLQSPVVDSTIKHLSAPPQEAQQSLCPPAGLARSATR